jgi:DNA-binding transcriptional MerR regulator
MATEPDPETAHYNLRQLAVEAGVTPRTIHFYIQQGLLPSAGTLGSQARYGQGHLARLRLIKRLQKEHLPLAEIADRIRSLTDPQVERLLGEAQAQAQRTQRTQRPPAAATSGSALDYVRGLLRSAPARQDDGTALKRMLARSAAAPASPVAADRSQWERVALVPEIELHVRRPLSRTRNRQLERLLESARQILQEEE